MEPSFVFVGGCERSGTSLVQKVLCSHSAIAGGAELMFSREIGSLHRRMAWTITEAPDEYSARLQTYFSREELDEIFRAFYRSLFSRIRAECPTAKYLSEKTPSNIFAAASLLQLFPGARFVHVVRDGRAVLASHRRVRSRLRARGAPRQQFRQFKVGTVCRRWNAAIASHLALVGDTSLAPRYYSLRFERLVSDPAAELGRLFSFLDLDMEEQVQSPESLVRRDRSAVVDGVWITEEMEDQPFDPARISLWRSELNGPARWLSGTLMAGGLRALSYSVGRSEVFAHRWLQGVVPRVVGAPVSHL